MKLKKIKLKKRTGLTLVELVLVAAMGVIVVFSTGIVLVDNQRGWTNTYNRVNSGVVVDGYAAKSAFDAVVRKSSIEARVPEIGFDNDYVELYYYDSIDSTVPDRYARFYLTDDEALKVAYGELSEEGEIQEEDSIVTLAENVTYTYFTVNGGSVQMMLNLDDGKQVLELRTSAIRNAQ
ncbi:MAG: hypothetical protein ACYTE8_07260 [Planctomycetota bacterium]|jgi:hypothetical protein